MAYGYGEKLKKAREAMGLKISDVYKMTKIDPNYVKAMEEERTDFFDREIYMKLFLKTYARFLKIDYKEILSLFENSNAFKEEETIEKTEDVAANVVRKETQEEKTTTVRSTIEMTISNPKNRMIILGSLILLIVLIVVIVVVNSNKNNNSKETEAKNIYVSPETEQTLKVVLKAKSDSWLKVRYGDKEEDFILKKGQEKEWKDIEKIVFLVGNAAGVEFIVNGESIGTIGEEGEVINGLVFQVGKNWFIDRNQGFKNTIPGPGTQATNTPTIIQTPSVNQNIDVTPALTKIPE
jgi:transcriptional regulator with XRE-family HTH domain